VLKKRLIGELQDSFSRHPVYRKITNSIQNRFAFTERPQFGIVVKGASGNKVALSADNFVGHVRSHVMLAYVGQPVYPIEWVKEDANVVREQGMPTLPGIYYIEILSAPTNATEPGYFVVDPLLTSSNEAVLILQSGIEREAQLQQKPVEGTLRLFLNSRVALIEATDYSVDYDTGAVTLLTRFAPNDRVTADYRYAGVSSGPYPFYWNQSDHTTLPGVILAFGSRSEAGQKIAVVVYSTLEETAQAYGGKFEVSMDLDVIARDNTQMEEIADLAFMILWAEKKALLEFEGIEVVDVSIGGEAEEPADETGDEYFYTSSLSVQLRADWEVHVPLPLTIYRVTETTSAGDRDTTAPLGIQAVTQPLFFQSFLRVGSNFYSVERLT